MNIEEQCLDLCNVKTKSNVGDDHNTTNNTEGITPRISELMTDGNTDKTNIVPAVSSETYLMPQLTDNLPAAEDNHQARDALEIDEVNGNRKSTAQDDPAAVNPTDLIFSDDEQQKDDIGVEKIKEDKDTDPAMCVVEEGDDGGDMDIGVDLTLDESGVLEAESTNDSLFTDKTFDSESTAREVPAGSGGESSSDASATDRAGLYPSVEQEDGKLEPSGKRVTFPSDEDIISGAVEPKDPWRHAQNVTVEEILSSYKQACQKLNCKPIPKVLKQMQEMKDLTRRNECLDLKGEKLDYKACESLEEILKRVQFKVIDLEQTNLDEDGATALFDMIEYYESATHLNISFNKHIGSRGWQAAAHMMRKTSSLQYLDARNTPLLDHSAPFVARALRISGSLAVLHLENAGLSGRPLMLLATALKMNMNLRELYLADNKLNGLQDSAQLGNLLKFNYNIQILDLRNNHILDSGLAYVCEGLKEQRKGLVTLVLWNNQLTHNGMGYLAAALPCTQSLETLNLGHNSLSNEGVHKLKDGLISNRSVLRLGLASIKLSCEGAVAVAEFIAESPRLLRLDLRENEIKTGGLMALSLALKVNTSLLRLDLDREPKKETSFIETQRALLAEIQNGCKRNFILAKEKEETEQKMRQSASMAEIATEDGTREEEEEGPSTGEKVEIVVTDGEEKGEATKKEEQSSSRSRESTETSIPQMILESDSDTEDEEAEVVTKSSSSSSSDSSARFNRTNLQPPTAVAQPPLGASCTSSPRPVSPAGGPSAVSGVTVTQSTAPPGTPPSPGRCISVSSPGRGHKIFMVTRVESPLEQQQQQLQNQRGLPGAPSLGEPASKKPGGGDTPPPSSRTAAQAQPTREGGVKASSPAPSTDPTLAERRPVAHSESAPGAPRAPPLTERPTEDASASALDLEATDTCRPAPATPSDSSSLRAAALQLTEQIMESIQTQRFEPSCVEEKKEDEDDGHIEDERRVSTDGRREPSLTPTTWTPAVQTQRQLSPPTLGNLQGEPASAAAEKQTEEEKEDPLLREEQEAAADLSEIEKRPTRDDPCPEQQTEEEERPVEPVPSVQADEPEPEETSKGPELAPTESESPDDEDSPEESSADEDECFADAPEEEEEEEEEEEIGSALPNGLKPEFSLHLIDAESSKPGSCVMEHVSVTCGQDLEELLLEASLETGRVAP
ncbi:protein phosphatase 1 regulatory subunit 37 isoform X2 [Pseudoliparis swirei]|uniref:protein phosphatase 1 regulatory subunit 37 isoform X2 n=1 Tax=Pseudoliparis swirei TaxID=2059687 RepID=UPI0024BE66A6|nr:protein phosphatase 1 regulatory subunit 37 isoform X2 [Pseudoliparis swirei]